MVWGCTLILPGQGFVFVKSAGQRQRPAVPDQPDIGQCLLDDDGSMPAFDNEHQIQISVTDLFDGPGSRIRADPSGDRLDIAQPRAK